MNLAVADHIVVEVLTYRCWYGWICRRIRWIWRRLCPQIAPGRLGWVAFLCLLCG